MTCMQPTYRYQFCWDCGGEYHTSSQCSRPKVTASAGSVLAFDGHDKKCANHFLARKVALRGIRLCSSLLERSLSTHTQSQAVALRVRCEAWQVLRDTQSALAHSCMVLYFTPYSAKLQFLYDELCALATSLQSQLEEGKWISLGIGNAPGAAVSVNVAGRATVSSDTEIQGAATAVARLRIRLRDYLLLAATEIPSSSPNAKKSSPGRNPAGVRSPSPSRRVSRGNSSPNGSTQNSRSGSLSGTPHRRSSFLNKQSNPMSPAGIPVSIPQQHVYTILQSLVSAPSPVPIFGGNK